MRGWPQVCACKGYRGFEARPGLLVLRVDEGFDETEEDALALVGTCLAYFQGFERPGRAVIVVTGINSQTRAARKVYQDKGGTSGAERLALVGEDNFSWAVLAFFSGIFRPRDLDLRLFRGLDSALEWTLEGFEEPGRR